MSILCLPVVTLSLHFGNIGSFGPSLEGELTIEITEFICSLSTGDLVLVPEAELMYGATLSDDHKGKRTTSPLYLVDPILARIMEPTVPV